MAKIEGYPEVSPSTQDYIIITDRDDANKTRNITIADLLALGSGSGFPGTLQQVTDAGATTTTGITVSGNSTYSAVLTSSGTMVLSGGVKDSANSLGTNGQLLSSNGSAAVWIDAPVDTLDSVTEAGNDTNYGIVLNTVGLTANAASIFNANVNFTADIQLNGSSGTSGQVLTSQGAGVDPIWSTLADTFSIYAADGTIAGNRVVTGGSKALTWTGLLQFNIASTPTVSIDGSTIATLKSATETVLEGTTVLKVRTPNVVGASATAGQFLRLVNATTGEAEYSRLRNGSNITGYVPKFDDDGLIMSRSSLQDDGTTSAFNTTTKANSQVSIATSVAFGLTVDQQTTGVNPSYAGDFRNNGISSLDKYGLYAHSANGTGTATQVGALILAGTTSTAGTSFANTQTALVGIAGALAGQDAYGAHFYAKENAADDNIGVKIDVANGGAGNAYLGQWTDGNEGTGKIVVSDASGNANWGSVGAGGLSELETSGAGAATIGTPTAGVLVHRVTGTNGSTDTKTLPATAGLTAGQIIWVIDDSGTAGTNNITVDTPGAETISGQPSAIIAVDYGVVRLVYNGTNYNLI